jgi:hypothetical protein
LVWFVLFFLCFYWFNCLLLISLILLFCCGDFNLSAFYVVSENNINILCGIFSLIIVAFLEFNTKKHHPQKLLRYVCMYLPEHSA